MFRSQLSPEAIGDDEGIRTVVVVAVTGLTYRQVDYYCRRGWIASDVRPARGSGSARLYSLNAVIRLYVVKRLLDQGIIAHLAIEAVAQLADRPLDELRDLVLCFSYIDGTVVTALAERLEQISTASEVMTAVSLGAVLENLGELLARSGIDITDPGD